jgi:hypothetical protein
VQARPGARATAPQGRRRRPALHRRWVERTFAPWLRISRGGSARRLAQLLAVTDVYVWKLLRRDQGLSRSNAEPVLIELLQLITGVS